MAHKDPLPHDYLSLLDVADKVSAGLVTYGVALGFSTADNTAAANDAAYARYVHTQQQKLRAASSQWTDWREALFYGGDGTAAAAPAFPGAPANPPVAVPPGLINRLRAIARRVKASPNYSVAIGKAFGVVGAEAATPDPVALQPVLTTTLNGGRVTVGWTRGSADALELYVDRGDGKGFVFLALDTVPDYVDTAPIPATPAVWKYKAMYRKDDQPIGQWSAVVSVGLGG
jgi:hypothetical protein